MTKGKRKKDSRLLLLLKAARIPGQPCAALTAQGRLPAISWPGTVCTPLESIGSAEARKPHSTHPEGTRALLQG